jgi:hypothetical protein
MLKMLDSMAMVIVCPSCRVGLIRTVVCSSRGSSKRTPVVSCQVLAGRCGIIDCLPQSHVRKLADVGHEGNRRSAPSEIGTPVTSFLPTQVRGSPSWKQTGQVVMMITQANKTR